jgi:hypothetical protein
MKVLRILGNVINTMYNAFALQLHYDLSGELSTANTFRLSRLDSPKAAVAAVRINFQLQSFDRRWPLVVIDDQDLLYTLTTNKERTKPEDLDGGSTEKNRNITFGTTTKKIKIPPSSSITSKYKRKTNIGM